MFSRIDGVMRERRGSSVLVETGALAECEAMIDSSVAEGLTALERAPMTGEARLALAELAVIATARSD